MVVIDVVERDEFTEFPPVACMQRFCQKRLAAEIAISFVQPEC